MRAFDHLSDQIANLLAHAHESAAEIHAGVTAFSAAHPAAWATIVADPNLGRIMTAIRDETAPLSLGQLGGQVTAETVQAPTQPRVSAGRKASATKGECGHQIASLRARITRQERLRSALSGYDRGLATKRLRALQTELAAYGVTD